MRAKTQVCSRTQNGSQTQVCTKTQNSTKTLVCYGNASAEIGSGHVMRLMALADAFKHASEGLEIPLRILFYAKSCPTALTHKLEQRGYGWQQAPLELNSHEINRLGGDIFIVDDYFLTPLEWQAIGECQALTLALDDAIAHHGLPVDAVLNPAPDQQEIAYRQRMAAPAVAAFAKHGDNLSVKQHEASTHQSPALLFLGPRYTLLRREFYQTPIPEFDKRQRILITLGGSDVKGLSLPLIRALTSALPDIAVTLIVGGLTSLDDDAIVKANAGNTPVTVLRNADNMAAIMAECGLALSAAGGTLGELAAMGVPTVALVCVDNQLPALTSSLEGSWYNAIDMRRWQPKPAMDDDSVKPPMNAITLLVEQLWHNPCKREDMSQKARQIVDSSGLIELANTLLQYNTAR